MDIVISSILVGLSTLAGTLTFYVNYGIINIDINPIGQMSNCHLFKKIITFRRKISWQTFT